MGKSSLIEVKFEMAAVLQQPFFLFARQYIVVSIHAW